MRTQNKLSFASKKEAVEYLVSKQCLELVSGYRDVFQDAGTYYLNHGEYSRPEYRVTRYGDGWGVKACHFYYTGTLYAPKDGRIEYDIWEDD